MAWINFKNHTLNIYIYIHSSSKIITKMKMISKKKKKKQICIQNTKTYQYSNLQHIKQIIALVLKHNCAYQGHK